MSCLMRVANEPQSVSQIKMDQRQGEILITSQEFF